MNCDDSEFLNLCFHILFVCRLRKFGSMNDCQYTLWCSLRVLTQPKYPMLLNHFNDVDCKEEEGVFLRGGEKGSAQRHLSWANFYHDGSCQPIILNSKHSCFLQLPICTLTAHSSRMKEPILLLPPLLSNGIFPHLHLQHVRPELRPGFPRHC